MLHHATAYCNRAYTATGRSLQKGIGPRLRSRPRYNTHSTHTATHCNTLQHTATHGNTLQHTATRCNTLSHAASSINTLQQTATHCNSALELGFGSSLGHDLARLVVGLLGCAELGNAAHFPHTLLSIRIYGITTYVYCICSAYALGDAAHFPHTLVSTLVYGFA